MRELRVTYRQDKPSATSLYHLWIFAMVAQLQGMQRASKACRLSQPAVTQAILKMEQSLGVMLLERHPRGCYVNEHGTLLLKRVQRMFDQIERALRDLKVRTGRAFLADMARDITRSQVRSLVGFAENGSFSKAAHALALSANGVLRDVRELELLLRTPLCTQTESGLRVRPDAAAFSQKLKLALHEIELAVQEIEVAIGKNEGDVVIGAMPLTGSMVLKSVISDVACEYPNANIRVMCESAEDMLGRVRRGDVDFVIGLLRQPTQNGLVSTRLAETPYVIAARKDHPLTTMRDATLNDIAQYQWIVGTQGSNRRAYFEKMFVRNGLPKARIATYSLPMMKALLMQSDCLTLLTSYEFACDASELACVPFRAIGRTPCLGLTMRRDWVPTRLQAGVLEIIRERATNSMLPTMLVSREKR